jgi:hypothetical protein
MMSSIPFRALLTTVAATAGAFLAAPAHADTCGISGTTTTSIGSYNAFAGSGINEVTVNLSLTRRKLSSLSKTRSVNFFLVQTSGMTGLNIRYEGRDVAHPLSRAPRLSLLFPGSATIYYNFGFFDDRDNVSLPLTVSVPPGIDLVAGEPLTFDILYVCDGTFGMDSVLSPAILPQGLTVRIDVASALQASWAGPGLNFGEIGNLDNAAAAQRAVTGAVRVASSGPYRVSVRSENAYRMTYPGGSPDDPQQRVSYAVNFMGRAASPDAPRTLEALCRRAGLSGENLPLTVRLLEGGSDKAAASEYKDILTITVTPLAASYSGALQDCP